MFNVPAVHRHCPSSAASALATTPAGYATTKANAALDGQWRFTTSTANITHMRNNGIVVHWDYTKGTNSGGNTDAVGTLSERGTGTDGASDSDNVHVHS